MYDLSAVLDVPPMAAVRPGTSILVSGPAMTGAEDLTRELLAAGATDDGMVMVTTSGTARDALEDIRDRAPEADPRLVCAIDCRGEDSSREEGTDDGAYIYHVSDPGDLTGMGIGITQSFDRLEGYSADGGRLGLASLSTMLTYTDRQTVFKFCHVLSSRVDSAEYVAAFTIDSSAHDEQTLQVVKQPFDGLIEIRERDGTREARVLGLQPDPTEWIPL